MCLIKIIVGCIQKRIWHAGFLFLTRVTHRIFPSYRHFATTWKALANKERPPPVFYLFNSLFKKKIFFFFTAGTRLSSRSTHLRRREYRPEYIKFFFIEIKTRLLTFFVCFIIICLTNFYFMLLRTKKKTKKNLFSLFMGVAIFHLPNLFFVLTPEFLSLYNNTYKLQTERRSLSDLSF